MLVKPIPFAWSVGQYIAVLGARGKTWYSTVEKDVSSLSSRDLPGKEYSHRIDNIARHKPLFPPEAQSVELVCRWKRDAIQARSSIPSRPCSPTAPGSQSAIMARSCRRRLPVDASGSRADVVTRCDITCRTGAVVLRYRRGLRTGRAPN